MRECPSRPGVYALNSSWIELPNATASKEKLRTGFPYHGVAIAVYSGASSSQPLDSNVALCISGAPLGTTFALGKAKEKKKSREVKVGTYSVFNSTVVFSIDKQQAIDIEVTRDKDGRTVFHPLHLESGQYVLFVKQGSSFSTIPPAFDFYVR
jgi:hypothetical protein